MAEVIAEGATASMVNLAEVATVLTSNHRDPNRVLEAVRAQVELAPFSDADALAVAALYPQVSGRGIPLGDRACLALARRLDASASCVSVCTKWRLGFAHLEAGRAGFSTRAAVHLQLAPSGPWTIPIP